MTMRKPNIDPSSAIRVNTRNPTSNPEDTKPGQEKGVGKGVGKKTAREDVLAVGFRLFLPFTTHNLIHSHYHQFQRIFIITGVAQANMAKAIAFLESQQDASNRSAVPGRLTESTPRTILTSPNSSQTSTVMLVPTTWLRYSS